MVQHREKRKEFYVFPGGGLEKGETFFQAAEREVLEETRINVKATNLIYLRDIKAMGAYGIEFYVLCNFVSGKIRLGHDPERVSADRVLQDVQWIELGSLKRFTWYPIELRHRFVHDVSRGFSGAVYLGMNDLSMRPLNN